MTNTQCTINMSVLWAAPYTLPVGSLVAVKVAAINGVGTSSYSTVNSVGALVTTVPDAPTIAPTSGATTDDT